MIFRLESYVSCNILLAAILLVASSSRRSIVLSFQAPWVPQELQPTSYYQRRRRQRKNTHQLQVVKDVTKSSPNQFDDVFDDQYNDDDGLLLPVQQSTSSSSSSSSSTSSSQAVYLNSDGGEDDDDTSCLPPYSKESQQMKETKHIFAISDSTGVTAKSTIQKCLAQFGDSCSDMSLRSSSLPSSETIDDNSAEDDEAFDDDDDCVVSTRCFTFIRSEETIASIIKKAQQKKAFVIFTIADPLLREKTLRMCELSNVPVHDLLGPSLTGLSTYLNREPIGIPNIDKQKQSNNALSSGGRRKSIGLSDSYYKRIESVEYTLKADDGQAPWLLPEADIIIVGVSRTGKTPLSVILSQTMGYKVANIPLVVNIDPPKELFFQEVDPRRIFCLTISPIELKRIRTTRLERTTANATALRQRSNSNSNFGSCINDDNSGLHQSNYNDRAHLLNDLRNAKTLATEHNWTEIDVTGRAVEETASWISELLNERFPTEVAA